MDAEYSGTLAGRDISILFDTALRGKKRGRRVGGLRRALAYLLKTVAAGGSLIIATNLFPDFHQGVGIAILVAILVDSVLSNHKRLLAEVEAGYAYGFLAENVGYKHNRALSPLLKEKQRHGEATSEAEKTQQKIDELELRTHKELADGVSEIAKRLSEKDIKALQALSLDNERAAAQQTGS